MSDLTKTPQQMIVDMVNTANTGQVALPAEFTFAAPAVEAGAKNTSILLTAAPGGRFSGTRTFFYDRLDFQDDVFSTNTAVFDKDDNVTTIADVVALLNDRYNLALTTDDYTASAFPTFSGAVDEEHTVTFTAKAGSLVYIGDGTITLKQVAVDMQDAMPQDQLNGLTFEI